MNTDLMKLALRHVAVYASQKPVVRDINHRTLQTLKQLNQYGYTLSEDALRTVNAYSPAQLVDFLGLIKEVLGVNCNWAALVKGWDEATGETMADHLVTWIANIFGASAGFKGTRLPCGHLIPNGTFNLERYNGCPFCGTPFVTSDQVFTGQGSEKKELRMLTDADMKQLLRDLIESPVALDATQVDSLKILLKHYPFPEEVEVKVKETAIILMDILCEKDEENLAQQLIVSPTDIMRFLWYRHTGRLQLLEPRTLTHIAVKNNTNWHSQLDRSVEAGKEQKDALKLHYNRTFCRLMAKWMNELELPVETICEQMHPKREMWVRFIRALRLTEYAKKEGYGKLKSILDIFYNETYPVWQGEVDTAKRQDDVKRTLTLLKQRPGVFARSLFSSMLHFGPEKSMEVFRTLLPKLPARLVMTLGMYAENYFFNPSRTVNTLSGIKKQVDANKLIQLYSKEDIEAMVKSVNSLYNDYMRQRFAQQTTEAKSVYIAPELYQIPIAIGDRSATIQDTSCALQGMTFPVEGDKVRVFMQWGKGLHKQHLDMDLSCHIAYDNDNDVCSYYNLSPRGARHSGDIQHIPEMVGAAEYIELDLPTLEKHQARFVTFTCNAYSSGGISPNLMLGWMSSAYPMTISDKNGVAYDPSCVQHLVRISSDNLSKGLVFGILDVARHEIIWLEAAFDGQTVGSLNAAGIRIYLRKLQAKTKIGDILKLKAEVQNQNMVDSPEQAEEVYDTVWAMNTAAVSKLLLG